MRSRKGVKLGPSNKWRKRECEWCGITFKCARFDAKTCKAYCRLAYYRWCKRWKRANGRRPLFGPRGDFYQQQDVSKAPPGEPMGEGTYTTR